MTYISWCSDFVLLNISNTVLWIYIILKMFVQHDTMSELVVLTECYSPLMLLNFPLKRQAPIMCTLLTFVI